ncbi:hypothetical protein Tsubulata_049635, partial [Turnera subulata]
MLRRIFAHEMLSKANLDSLYPLRKEEVMKSVRGLYGKIGLPVNIREVAFCTVINMISSMSWGGALDEVNDETDLVGQFRALVPQITDLLQRPNVSDFFPVLARFDLQGMERRMKKLLKQIEETYDLQIDRLLEEERTRGGDAKDNQRKNFLHFLLEFKDHETGKPISRQQIKALLMEMEDMITPTMLCILLLPGTLILFLWSFTKLRSVHEPRLLPPGPRGLPIIGYLPFLTPNLHQLFLNLARTYGPIYKLSLGQKLCIVISSPTLAKEVVQEQDIIFANRSPTIAASTFSFGKKDIACAAYGPEWRMLRRIFAHEMLSNANLDSLYPLRREEVMKSVRELYGKIGQRVNIREVAFCTVTNVISSMTWGGTLGAVNGETDLVGLFRALVPQLTDLLQRPNVSDFFPVLARFDIQGVERKMKKLLKQIEETYDFQIDRLVKEVKTRGEDAKDNQRKNFLHFLLEFRDHETGEPISRRQIKALLMDCIYI